MTEISLIVTLNNQFTIYNNNSLNLHFLNKENKIMNLMVQAKKCTPKVSPYAD